MIKIKELIEHLWNKLERNVNQKKLALYLKEHNTNATDYLYKLVTANKLEKEFELTQIVRANMFEEEE